MGWIAWIADVGCNSSADLFRGLARSVSVPASCGSASGKPRYRHADQRPDRLQRTRDRFFVNLVILVHLAPQHEADEFRQAADAGLAHGVPQMGADGQDGVALRLGDFVGRHALG